MLILVLPALLLATPDISHLEPVTSAPFGDGLLSSYREKVHQVLLPTSNREAQMVILAPFAPEAAVYIKPSEDGTSARLVYRQPRAQIWGVLYFLVMEGTEGPPWSFDGPAVEALIRRTRFETLSCEAPIDPELRAAMVSLWRDSLSATRYPREANLGMEDGTSFIFAQYEQGVGYRAGETTSPTGILEDLVNVGVRAAHLACAPAGERARVRADLLNSTTALATRMRKP